MICGAQSISPKIVLPLNPGSVKCHRLQALTFDESPYNIRYDFIR